MVALATGALVANLYYAQPLIAAIGPALGIEPGLAGAVVSVTQIGYGVGLFFLVSLADRVENRRLVLGAVAVTCLALVGAATARGAAVFFAASFLIGLCSTGAQVLLPLVVQLAPPERRGRVVGNLMAGLLTGIMLARPAALFVADGLGWRAVFWISAGLMAVIGAALAVMMPTHAPPGGPGYGRILVSMVGLLRRSPALRRRAIYQAGMFAAFNLFWTAAPLMLADRFHLGGRAIGIFALAGAGGALAAPVAGRLADRGHARAITAAAMAGLGLAFIGTGWLSGLVGLLVLAVLTVIIDAAVQANQVVSQRLVFAVPAAMRGRANGIYMTVLFAGGALGSFLGAASYHRGGWVATAILGAGLGAAVLAFFATEPRVSTSAGA